MDATIVYNLQRPFRVQNNNTTALLAHVNVAQTIFIVWISSHKIYPVGSRSVVSYKKPQFSHFISVAIRALYTIIHH